MIRVVIHCKPSFQFVLCRSSADSILEKAQGVILALEEAKKAQEAAQSAINQANNDITGAEQDLNQVGGRVDAGIYLL